MANNSSAGRRKATGRSAPSHLGIPHYVTRSDEFGALTGWQLKTLVEIAAKFTGFNNGDLSLTWQADGKQRGFRSKGTLWDALNALQRDGWLIVTRHGRRNVCNLYAVSWWPVDECKGKFLEVPAERSPSNRWQKNKIVTRYAVPVTRYADSIGPELVYK